MKKILLLLILILGCQPKIEENIVRVGWMTSWAPVAQIVLASESYYQKIGMQPSFSSFQYGPEINEAAVGGRLDLVNLGVVPALNLLAASDQWMIAAKILRFPVSVVARNDINAEKLSDLRGRKIGVPFGGGAHPFIISALKAAGLDTEVINIKPSEQLLGMKQRSIDGAATWEPQTSILVNEVPGKIIHQGTHVGFVLVSRSWLEKDAVRLGQVKNLYKMAIAAYLADRALFDNKYSTLSKVPLSIIEKISLENLKPIDVNVGAGEIELAQKVADEMFEIKLLPKRVNVSERVLH